MKTSTPKAYRCFSKWSKQHWCHSLQRITISAALLAPFLSPGFSSRQRSIKELQRIANDQTINLELCNGKPDYHLVAALLARFYREHSKRYGLWHANGDIYAASSGAKSIPNGLDGLR